MMTTIKWPHGPETLVEHLERLSTYLYRKRKHDIGNLTVMVYGMYLHYKTETGYYSELYEDLNKPIKNKVFSDLGISGVMQYGVSLIERIQNELGVIVAQ